MKELYVTRKGFEEYNKQKQTTDLENCDFDTYHKMY